MVTVIVTSHELENILTRMLEWYVKIWEEVPEFLELGQMIECEDIWIEIVDTEFWSP